MDQWPPCLVSGKFIWTNGPSSSPKVSPETGIGPWMALSRSLQCKYYITGKLTQRQLCNVIGCPHGMLCNNARTYITEEIVRTTSAM